MSRPIPLLILLAALLAGCTQAPSDGVEALGVDGTMEPSQGLANLSSNGCTEIQAEFPADPGDFEGGLPPGFMTSPGLSGLATITVLARTCTDPTVAGFLFAFVLVEPDAEVARPGAVHAVLLDLWTDSPALFPAFAAMGLKPEGRAVHLATTDLGAATETKATSEPDFLLAVQATGEPQPSPYDDLRLFAVGNATLVGGFDMTRDPRPAREGVATASFVMAPDVEDRPDHRAGSGRILGPETFVAAYKQIPI